MITDDEEFIIDNDMPEPDNTEDAGTPGNTHCTAASDDDRSDDEPEEKKGKVATVLNNIYRFLSGDFLTKENFAKQFPFILYIIFLLMLLVASSYHMENTNNQIRVLTKKIEQYHTQHIYLKAAITKEIKQSTLVEKLKHREIKESTQPIKKIEFNKENKE